MEPSKPTSVESSSSNRGSVSFPKNHIIEINGKKFRVKEVVVDGKSIDVNKLKSDDITHLKSFAADAIKNSQQEDSSFYTISLTANSAVVNANESQGVDQKNLDNIKTLGKNLLKIRKAEKKHTFKSSLPSDAKATAIKVGVVALFILASPLIIAVGLLITGGVLLGDLASSIKHAVLETDDLKEAAEKMKGKEEKKKFNSLAQIHKAFAEVKIPDFKNKEFLEANLQNKAERHINRALVKNSSDIKPEAINKLVKKLKIDDFKNEDDLKAALFKEMPGLEKVLEDSDIRLLVKEAEIAFVDTTEQDQKALKELQDALNATPSDYAAANKRVTQALRNVINSPSYQAIKENPDNPYVKYISHLSCGLWNKTKVMEEYQEFGKVALKSVDQTKIEQQNLTSGEKQRKIMEEAHTQTKRQIYTDHGIPAKILYAFTHPKQALGSMNSEGGYLREIASTFGVSKYDSHGELNNDPSLQGITKATFTNGKKASINNCYGGSPTIGNRYQTVISPEFEAVCQAVENKKHTQVKDPEIPDVIYYTNLQNIENHHGEGERSFAIMELNDRYPGTFVGMTLAKDSKFHLMPNEKEKLWPGASEYGKEMLKIFENEKCYQYGNRTKTQNKQGEYKGGNGIYLPGGKEAWFGKDGKSGPIPQIIEQANIRFGEIEKQLGDAGKEKDSFKLKSAYQEYVYSMIQSYMEMQLAIKTDGQVMAIRACKENIDRGGAENVKYTHARLNPKLDENERNEIVVGAMESRALSVRGRVVLEKRMHHALSFIELVEPKAIQKDTVSLLETQGMQFAPDGQPKYKPAI